jgi:hypothetical protein
VIPLLAKSSKTVTLTVEVKAEHIKDTLRLELQRRKYHGQEIAAGNEPISVCAPDKGYCSSCPVANAFWELLYQQQAVKTVDVDGFTVDIMLSNIKPGEPENLAAYWYYSGSLPEEINSWIPKFDAWLEREDYDEVAYGGPDSIERAQYLLDHPEDWPIVPAPFVITLSNVEYAGV